MAPQTRSRTSGGAVQSSMDDLVTRTAPEASSKSSAAKKPKVYQSSGRTPTQLHFPARNKTIRTYGKGKARRSLPSKTSEQSTLTQIGWIPSTCQEEEDDMDGLINLVTDDEEDDAEDAKKKKPARRTSKRRKTTGDLDTVPDSTAGSSFHTQTLTQMPSFLSGQQPEDDEPEDDFSLDGFEDEQKAATSMTDSNRKWKGSSLPQERKKGSTPEQQVILQAPQGRTPTHVSQTPRKQIIEREVIPSSQPSPFTPNLGISERYWSQMDRTPLKERSTNVDAPTPKISRKRPRTLEVADSWSTVNGGMGSSPGWKVHRTPLKEINLAEVAERSVILGETPAHDKASHTPGEIDKFEEGAVVLRTASETQTSEKGQLLSQKSMRSGGNIILDSEDDFDFELDDDSVANDEAPGTPTPATRANTQGPTASVAQETGAMAQTRHESSSTTPRRPATQRNSTPNPQPENEEPEPETPSPSPQRRASISSVVEVDKETPLSSPQKTSPALPSITRAESDHRQPVLPELSPQKGSQAMPPVSQLGSRYKSQAFESQRVPFERIQRLGPQTDRSDIIVSIAPNQAEQIAGGYKTHEFRDYRIPQTVGRIWIYITRPVCKLKYMATISGAKGPGEVSNEDPGVGNEEFNEGKGLKFAYELKQVYELNDPVPLARMKQNGWVEEAPARYVYIPPAVLGELMGNLKCELFVEGEPQSSQGGMSVSQEVEMQLRSDIAHSTQVGYMGSSQAQSPNRGAVGDANIIPSSQGDEKEELTSSPPRATVAAANRPAFAKPVVPASRSQRSVHWVEDSPVGRRAKQASQQAEGYTVRPSQATTASAPSSPSQQLPPYRGQPILIPSQSQPSIPVSPPTKAAPPGIGRGSSCLVSDPGQDGEDAVVGDSPVRRQGVEIQSSSVPLGSSQGFLALGSGEPDSLLDDSRVRQPPEIVWDSEEEID